jgi:hypothetical protein
LTIMANPEILDAMSHLSDEIDRQLANSSQSVDDVVRKTGLTRSLVYLWKRGDQTAINEEQLATLSPALSSLLHDHAALVRAHLLDEKFGPGSELVRVEIDIPAALKDQPRARSKGERALEFLTRERLVNRDLNDLLIDLARCLGEPGDSERVAPYGSSSTSPSPASTAEVASALGRKAAAAISELRPAIVAPTGRTARRARAAASNPSHQPIPPKQAPE